jgi:tripartite-type tricarboxylate transporter receptor subunit TctC
MQTGDSRRAMLRGALAGALLAPLAGKAALAQAGDWPTKPVRLIVPFPPGQAADIFARLVGERLGTRWGHQVVVENRGGGAGIPALEAVARSAPDGYTLLMGSSGTLGVNPTLYSKLPYDSINDFAPCSNVFLVPLIIVAHPSFPASSLAELIALAKAQPGKVGYASAGMGTSQHLSMELFRHRAGLDITHIPYKGSGPAMTDLLGGHVTLMMDSVTSALPHIRDKRVKAIAVTTAKRAPLLPDVPSISETIAGFDAAGWSGIVAPARTPAAIVEKVSADIRALLADPAFAKIVEERGGIPDPGTPAQYHAFIKAEVAKWGEVVKLSGAKAD